jgi:hypothetical protein
VAEPRRDGLVTAVAVALADVAAGSSEKSVRFLLRVRYATPGIVRPARYSALVEDRGVVGLEVSSVGDGREEAAGAGEGAGEAAEAEAEAGEGGAVPAAEVAERRSTRARDSSEF